MPASDGHRIPRGKPISLSIEGRSSFQLEGNLANV
jgi:hypothetical protein